MADDELGDLLGPDSDGPAYQKVERRRGPPLDYVAEKLMRSLELLQHSIRTTELGRRAEPAALGQPGLAASTERLLQCLKPAFRYELVAFLALVNMLGLANDRALPEDLLGRDGESFSDWLQAIKANGSVTGLLPQEEE